MLASLDGDVVFLGDNLQRRFVGCPVFPHQVDGSLQRDHRISVDPLSLDAVLHGIQYLVDGSVDGIGVRAFGDPRFDSVLFEKGDPPLDIQVMHLDEYRGRVSQIVPIGYSFGCWQVRGDAGIRDP